LAHPDTLAKRLRLCQRTDAAENSEVAVPRISPDNRANPCDLVRFYPSHACTNTNIAALHAIRERDARVGNYASVRITYRL
jgi:hypothetical protein